MASATRKLRRAQERQMAQNLRRAQRQAVATIPEPSPADGAAERLGAMGIPVLGTGQAGAAGASLWTPEGAQQ